MVTIKQWIQREFACMKTMKQTRNRTKMIIKSGVTRTVLVPSFGWHLIAIDCILPSRTDSTVAKHLK